MYYPPGGLEIYPPDLLSLDLLEVVGTGQQYMGRVRAHLAAGHTEPAGGGGPDTTEPSLDSSATAARGKQERVLVSFFR